jgi:hypothetical protein
MTPSEIQAFLRENLSLNVKTQSSYQYGGGYKNDRVVELVLAGEVISEITLESEVGE